MNLTIQKAIDLLGSQQALAKACGAKQQHVWNWLQAKSVPVDRAIQIEVATGGEVTKEELCPEFFNALPKITIARRRR
jgi:DNA-binding transcriptional regulator YdaS (Cro superfamily)